MPPAVLLLAAASAAVAAEALILDRSHSSEVFGETRHYRIFLPPDYETSGKRYPVVYWFHGYSERYNKSIRNRNYDQGGDYHGDSIAAFVGAHDLIVVKWDGYNPRTPEENYPRPYNISPVETHRQFPLYFPELVAHIDGAYRTIADREHRGTAGLSMGGFMSYWVAGKYPHLVSSASNFMGSSEFFVGPRGFDVEYRHEEMRHNYEGVRTRIVVGARDFIQFYHRRMNAIWNFTRAHHESEEFDFDHGTPALGKTLAFHMKAFADPLPAPRIWSHADVYPHFGVWNWEVSSNRKRPGITLLENVSRSGFRSGVREWLPGGRAMPEVRLSVTSAPLYPAGQEQVVTVVRLRDGRVRRHAVAADGQGRLTFELDGDDYEMGIGEGPLAALAGFRLESGDWAVAGQPVKLHVKFWNKGVAVSVPAALKWETANPSVLLHTPVAALPAIPAGGWVEVPLAFTVMDESREIVRLAAGGLPLEIPLFPPASPGAFRVADGGAFPVYRHAVKLQTMELGSGDRDGVAEPGEAIAVLLPDGDGFRAAELFTGDACLDNTERVSDVWSSYDHVGASAKYSLARLSSNCVPGRAIRALARVQLPNKPNHGLRYATVEIRVGGAPGK